MTDRLWISAAVIASAYLLCTVLIYPVRLAALRFGIIDRPGERKSHEIPVPRIGGIAIVTSLILVVGGSLLLIPHLQNSWVSRIFPTSIQALSQYPLIRNKLWALFAGILLVAVLGFWDDIKGTDFSPYIKLAGQTIAAAILVASGISVDLFSPVPWLGVLVSIVWLVGITNSFNLLDNMDGLSSGIALICSAIFLILVMLKGEFFIALLLSALIGSILGFYQFNMRGGFIFMGDSGSLVLGYMLGAVAIMARYVNSSELSLLPVLSPLIILGLPLFDTFSVIIIRWRENRPIFMGDQMHLSHRLVRMGMSRRQAVLFNYLIAFTIAINSLLMLNSGIVHTFVAAFQVVALISMISILMATQFKSDRPAAGSSFRDPGENADQGG
jgi:UDP-GlcNAc:undecaprenyl-phosphate/decaprenyl-phosphate GlcNAc-1-phosphate transferase